MLVLGRVPLRNNPFHCRGSQGYPQKSKTIRSKPRCSKLSGLSSRNSVAGGGLHGSESKEMPQLPKKVVDLEEAMTWP